MARCCYFVAILLLLRCVTCCSCWSLWYCCCCCVTSGLLLPLLLVLLLLLLLLLLLRGNPAAAALQWTRCCFVALRPLLLLLLLRLSSLGCSTGQRLFLPMPRFVAQLLLLSSDSRAAASLCFCCVVATALRCFRCLSAPCCDVVLLGCDTGECLFFCGLAAAAALRELQLLHRSASSAALRGPALLQRCALRVLALPRLVDFPLVLLHRSASFSPLLLLPRSVSALHILAAAHLVFALRFVTSLLPPLISFFAFLIPGGCSHRSASFLFRATLFAASLCFATLLLLHGLAPARLRL